MRGTNRKLALAVLLAAVAVGLMGTAVLAACRCDGPDCYEDIVIANAGSTEVNGTYQFVEMYQGRPLYEGGNSGEAVIYFDMTVWLIASPLATTHYSITSTADTPPSAGWEKESGSDPLPAVSGGQACTPPPAPVIALYSHTLGRFMNSGETYEYEDTFERGKEWGQSLDFRNTGTGMLTISSATISTSNCTARLPHPLPRTIEQGGSAYIVFAITITDLAPWSATFTFHNDSTNEASFVLTIAGAPVRPFIVIPTGASGGDSILDRVIELESGETPPVAGYKALSAIYEIGETISGALMLKDGYGNPVRDTRVQVELYKLDLDELPFSSALVLWFGVRYDMMEGAYVFELDTTDLPDGTGPGYYDLRFAFADASAVKYRIQLIEPSP